MFKKMQRGFTLIELMIVVAIIGILAAIAIPNFTRFQTKAKQSEAKTNLKAIFTAAKSYQAEKDTYNCTPTQLGFTPEAGNRYNYAYNAQNISPAGSRGCGVTTGAATDAVFFAAASANIDTDTVCDLWGIDNGNSMTNVVNDVTAE